MIEESIFYILGSIFFGIVIIFLLIVVFYWIKILKNFNEVSKNIKETSIIFKEKTEGISGIITGLTVLVEKIIKFFSQKEKNKKGQNS